MRRRTYKRDKFGRGTKMFWGRERMRENDGPMIRSGSLSCEARPFCALSSLTFRWTPLLLLSDYTLRNLVSIPTLRWGRLLLSNHTTSTMSRIIRYSVKITGSLNGYYPNFTACDFIFNQKFTIVSLFTLRM